MYLLLLLLFTFEVCVCQYIVLYNTQKDLRVATISKTKKPSWHAVAKDLQEATSITYLHSASIVCWVDDVLPQIECASFNGTHTWNRTVYAKMVPAGDGIACDWLTRKLYWTDNVSKRIEVVSLETRHRKVLYWQDIDQPRGIAVDPSEGVLFWTDWGDSPKIERASMNGDPNLRKVIIDDNIYWPNSITLDVETKKLYWLDGKYCFIEVTNYNGGERTTLIDKGLKYPHAYPFALSMSSTKFYWTDWGTHSIYSIDRTGGDYADQLIQSSDQPIFDIDVYDAKLQPYAHTPCEQNNGGCSHLCLLSAGPERYSCACPTGIRLINNRSCAHEEEQFLFLVQRTEISRVSLDTPDHTNFELPLRGVKHAVAIDVDPVDKYFYWTDMDTQSIRRAKWDGTQQETIVSTDIFNPDGIAVDWIAKNLYWCDVKANRIEMIRLNTSFRKVVVFEDLEQPRAVVVFPQQGWLFWSDWNEQKPKIERSDLDGSNRLILVKTDIIWPNGLALDYENKKLYFGDARTDKIEVINVDGHERHEVIGEDLSHIFSLTVLGDYLYWTDWSRRTLESANKNSPRLNRTIILDQLQDVMGLKAISRNAPNGTNPCALNNGNCAHFCLNKPGNKYVCACQVEYELLSDKSSCVLPDSYFMVLSNNRIRRVSVSTASTDVIPINNVKSISAIDVSPADRRVYWADSRMKTISRGFINGSRVEKIVSCGLQSPESVAIDWIAGNVYWADASLRRIEVVTLNGHYRRTLFWSDLNEPRNLVVDPRVGFMFWSEWNGDSGMIVKAHMDGSTRRAIVENIGRVNGLTIDYTLRFLYWTHNKNDVGYIERCNASGQNRKVIFEQSFVVPYSITHSEDFVFWTKNSSIMRLHVQTGNRAMVHTLMNFISNLSVVDSAKRGGWNGCAVNNNDCKYLCLVRPGFEPFTTETTCACPTHYSMRDNVCQPPENFLLFSQRNALYRLATNTGECPDFPLLIPGLKGVRAIEYDSSTKSVYWIENKTKKMSAIKRSTENNTNNEVLLGPTADTHFWDLAIEPFSKRLFWTSSTTNSINVTRLDNTSIGCIFEAKNGEIPRNLALHPEKGLLFWTDVGESKRVVQSRLDGDEDLTIETEGTQVDALTVDRRSSILYIAYGGRLYAYNIADRIRRPLLEVGSGKVLSLAVTRSLLYWMSRDADTQRIERVIVNVNTVSDRMVVLKQSNVSHVSHVIDLIAIDPADDAYPSHPCSRVNNHGNCSHLCLPSMENLEEAECSCPLTLQLSDDRRTCIVLSPSSTPEPDRTNGADIDCANSLEESCSSKSILLDESHPESSSSTQFLVAFAVLVSLAVVGVCFYCKQKVESSADTKQDMAVMRPLATTSPACQAVTTGSSHSPISLINAANSVISYPPSYVTGISSSSSMIHCPLNPPPSPTTTTMQQDECSCSDYAGPMPMPTPCSTDVCESDASYPSVNILYLPDRRNRSRRQNRYQQQRMQNSDYEEMPYRSSEILAPPPPPPTPRYV